MLLLLVFIYHWFSALRKDRILFSNQYYTFYAIYSCPVTLCLKCSHSSSSIVNAFVEFLPITQYFLQVTVDACKSSIIQYVKYWRVLKRQLFSTNMVCGAARNLLSTDRRRISKPNRKKCYRLVWRRLQLGMYVPLDVIFGSAGFLWDISSEVYVSLNIRGCF